MDIILRNVLITSILFSIGDVFSDPVDVILSHNGPIVLDANITITAKLVDSLNQAPTGNFAFEWHDSAIPRHRQRPKTILEERNGTVQWNISYPSKHYSAQEYVVTVSVYKLKILYILQACKNISFNVTETLNGKIHIEQDWKEKEFFVSTASPVKHNIVFTKPDQSFIANNATSVLTFWFVDCVYYGYSTDFSFVFNYTEEKTYNVETLVVASFDHLPLISIATTTTTTSTTKTTSTTLSFTTSTQATPIISTYPSSNPASATVHKSTTILKTNRSSPAEDASTEQILMAAGLTDSWKLSTETEETSTSAVSVDSQTNTETKISPVLSSMISKEAVLVQKRHVVDYGNIILNSIGIFSFNNTVFSNECLNKTFIPFDPKKRYGYFQTQISAKVPITKVNVKGKNWLQFGDVLNLNISCNGSAKFEHCTKIKVGVHNVTGYENCSSTLQGDVCNFTLTHNFHEANTYTFIIVIMNNVSKVVTPAVIRMYEVQPQLSGIVVPVTCSLLAIIIIVFGVAYYVQSQNRYTVEVADFDSGQANDMEYKSFYEKQREEISNMFNGSGGFLLQKKNYDYVEKS